ncbi:FIT family protein CG10671 isoform 1 [Tropilaelaps mercedesae]|uniref:FIT family protein CG10671 isoform 1 n=1 Tax=Tropilaelaps mercedesae TaxID=418985 RepID=A0A1V9X155_9ACAR|nr:FIT family protein CG10671 isoform 1 [Tropilaelaps mercedesae]
MPLKLSSRNGDRRGASLKWDNTRKGSTVSPIGRRPLPEPMTIGNTILMVILHVCRRAVLIDAKHKVGIYLGFLFIGSTISDIGFPVPKTYFSNKSNVFNVYFVKFGWGWTMALTSLYIYLTSSVYCAGDKHRITQHLLRMLTGTAIWSLVTNFFVYVESKTGACSASKIVLRSACLDRGHRWIGFDISGHCFLLIFCHLLISEELRTLFNWERIADIIRNEQFDEESPMNHLNDEQKQALRKNYPRYTPYIRALFIALTMLALLWDVMLVGTVLYFHTMVQKVAGGIFAVLCWYFAYRFWYPSGVLPPMPGVGLIRYSEGYRRA